MNKNASAVTFIVIFCIAISNAGSTLYLPALVNITEKLHTTSAMMKYTLSSYLIAMAISQLFYGPLSEAFGRKKCLTAGLIIAIVGGLVTSNSEDIDMLIVGRMIVGLGFGAMNSVGIAMFRDLFHGKLLSKKLSLVSVYLGITSTIASVIGGYIVVYLGWRFCFITITVLASTALLINVLRVKETKEKLKKDAWKPSVALREYKFLLSNWTFLGSVLSVATSYGSLLAFYSLLPFLVIRTMRFTPDHYGWFLLLIGAAFVMGANFAKVMVSHISKTKLVMIGNLSSAFACLVGYVLGEIGLDIYIVIIPAAVVTFGMGIAVPITSSCAITPFPDRGGPTSALIGCAQFLGASLMTAIATRVHEVTQDPMFLFVGSLSLISFLFILIPHFRMRAEDN